MSRDPYSRFAKYYDMMYNGKLDYEFEVRWLEKAFHRFGVHPRAILDMGCGTGGHALPLAAKGYEVVGLDRSPNMLTAARQKAKKEGLKVTFIKADMSSFSLERRFDAAICMFGGWGYMVNDKAAKSAIRHVHDHLEPGGLFIVEFWGEGGVRPESRGPHGYRSWDFAGGNPNLLRWSVSRFDARRHTLSLTMRHLVYTRDRIVDEFTDRHVLRTYQLPEMRGLLAAGGFKVLGLFRFSHSERGFVKAGKTSFNTMAISIVR